MTKTPLVSICCITYNHAPFIRQSLDGMLMQEGVDFEILIHDDCSTDGTTEIVKEYAAKYPDKIFPLYETENQYSKGIWVDALNYSRARGVYIADCEGDDYWIDSRKLLKQIDFLNNHQDFSVCFCRCNHLSIKTGEMSRDINCDRWLTIESNGIEVSTPMFFYSWITQPLTMVYRVEYLSLEKCKKYKHYWDTYFIYDLLQEGKGYLMNFVGGVHIHTGKGISSGLDQIGACQFELASADELHAVHRNRDTYKYWCTTVEWARKTYLAHKRIDLTIRLFFDELKLFPIKTLILYLKIYKRSVFMCI